MYSKTQSSRFFSSSSRPSFMKCMVLGLCLFPMNMATAEMRHHDSHVHGEGTLNIAIADKEVHIELESPAANIVGFEHSPQNQEQEEAVHLAEKQLKNGGALFIFNEAGDCKLVEAKVAHDMEGEHHHKDDHGHDHGHEDGHHHDGHKDGHDHEHGDKDDHHHDEHKNAHGEKDGHHHDGHEDAHKHEADHHDHEGDVHSEFHATYKFECGKPEKIKSVTVELFETFKSFEKVDVQLLSPKGQTAATLTPQNHKIEL